jgi:hypothetical protein
MGDNKKGFWVGLVVVALAFGCTLFNAVCMYQYAKNQDRRPLIELSLDNKDWEGVLWQGYTGEHKGLAVREISETALKGEGYRGNEVTPWGFCHRWSINSRGRYCLIEEKTLTSLGREVLFDCLHSKDYTSIP